MEQEKTGGFRGWMRKINHLLCQMTSFDIRLMDEAYSNAHIPYRQWFGENIQPQEAADFVLHILDNPGNQRTERLCEMVGVTATVGGLNNG